MTKEYIDIVETSTSNTKKEMSTLDKIIIVWFIAKAINIMYLLYKRYISK